jgi:hypothetical protein
MGPAAIDRAQRDPEGELPKGPTGKILKREIQVPTAVGAKAR